jgi:hypothetical protein
MNCHETIPLLDSFADKELSGPQCEAVAAHLARCRECAARVEAIGGLKRKVAAALGSQPTPLGLETRLRARLHEAEGKSRAFRLSFAWASALAVAVLTIGGWAMVWKPIRQQVLAVLGAGADDHVHCSLERKNPPFGALQRPIDPEYGDLLARVTSSMPSGYQLRESHSCRSKGKRFQHIVFEREGSRVSVIVTPKTVAGEFPALGVLASRMRASGIPLYSADRLGVSVAGFATGDNVAFVVSDLGQETNLRLLAGLAPGLTGVMDHKR